ncbi:hypothetical protein GCM10008090_12240 [Arenicella chitinivorans]|uniref:Uncharacterized protein n=1 Tax=Arenicella chitinivorans TaxID=1329800 RepID=A0A918RNV1_9GAMM|nr:hypothetical protein [Arenicella chitinivorans]GHA04424.1 hypothetical protein GCM10008090_12240 [Arenicella chitinivorans]
MNSAYQSTRYQYRWLTAAWLLTTIIWTGNAVAQSNFVKAARLPSDVQPSCTADISPWFAGDEVTPNGWVKPANSLAPIFADFKNNTRCDFYKWGAQMFLWLTSGEGVHHVFNTSPGFYNISVEEDGKREFLPGGLLRLGVRKAKTDEQIELGQAGGFDVLVSQTGSLVYYGLHVNDVFALYTTGKKMGAFNDRLRWLSGQEDPACLAQYESCASKDNVFCSKQLEHCTHNNFPATKDQLDVVSEFADSYGYPLGYDKIALALELKTSWIELDQIIDPQRKATYVTERAVVPVFDRAPINTKTKKQQWPIVGTKETTLALVGMHVVGTVNGHPEMIWSTFEHVSNAPDAAYEYLTATGKGTQAYDASGTWNFMQEDGAEPTAITANARVSAYEKSDNYPDPECQRVSKDDTNTECIVNIAGQEIGTIDVLRVDPWGNDQSLTGALANNTDLASINVSVLSQLELGDVRGNYIQTGGVWTSEGQIPKDGKSTDLRGSLKLANTTMETFFQFPPICKDDFTPLNCFGCHGAENATEAVEISHIFDALQPLPKK